MTAALQQLAIVTGIFASQIVAYLLARAAGGAEMTLWGHGEAWRWMYASAAVPAFIYGALALGIPESPRYLVRKQRIPEAKAVLTKMIGGNVDEKVKEIEDSLKGNLDQVISDNTKAIELNPTLVDAYMDRGSARDDRGDYAGAIADYDRVIAMNPNSDKAFYNRGLARYRIGDINGAIADDTKTVELNPSYSKAYNNRAHARLKARDLEGTISDYSRVIEQEPKNARAYNDLAWLLARDSVEPKKLSRAANETLAIIAYHQPVTRAEIEDIRGVSVSKGTLDVLMETGWVRPRGRRKAPGRPLTFGTTETFLSHFGLEAIGDLPGLDELKGTGLLDGRLPPGFSIPLPSDDTSLRDDEDPLEPGDLDLGLAPRPLPTED